MPQAPDDGDRGRRCPGRGGALAAPAARKSWAPQAEADVAIWTLPAAARRPLDPAPGRRGGHPLMLYWLVGDALQLEGEDLGAHAALQVEAGRDLALVNTGGRGGRAAAAAGPPAGRTRVQYGPFVMNTQQQIMQAMQDFRRTQFGAGPGQPGPGARRHAAPFLRAIRADRGRSARIRLDVMPTRCLQGRRAMVDNAAHSNRGGPAATFLWQRT